MRIEVIKEPQQIKAYGTLIYCEYPNGDFNCILQEDDWANITLVNGQKHTVYIEKIYDDGIDVENEEQEAFYIPYSDIQEIAES